MRSDLRRLFTSVLAPGVGSGGVTYLYRATFADTDDAPMTTPRAEMVGESIISQTDNIFSTNGASFVALGTIASGAKNYLAASASGSILAFAYTPGRVLQATITYAGGYGELSFFNSDPPSTARGGVVFEATNKLHINDDSAPSVPENLLTSGLSGTYALIMREGGGLLVVKDEKLLYVPSGRSSIARYAGYATQFNGAHNWSIAEMSVYDVPANSPLKTEYGLATSRVASPANGETITQEGNAFLELTWTPQTAEALTVLFRRVDDNNCLKLVCTQGGNLQLYEVVGGTPTEINAGKTQAWTVGTPYSIKIYLSGTTVKTFVANVIKHNTTSTVNQTATTAKLSSTATPTVTNFVAWRVDLTGFPFV